MYLRYCFFALIDTVSAILPSSEYRYTFIMVNLIDSNAAEQDVIVPEILKYCNFDNIML